MIIKAGTRVEIGSPDSINMGRQGIVEQSNSYKSLVRLVGGGLDTVRWFNNFNLIILPENEGIIKASSKDYQKRMEESEQWYLVVDKAAIDFDQVMSKDDVEGYLNDAVEEEGQSALDEINVYKLADPSPVTFKTELSIED